MSSHKGKEKCKESEWYFFFMITLGVHIREFKITTTATAMGTSLNKRFNEQKNGCARLL